MEETVKYDNFEIEKELHTFLEKKGVLQRFISYTALSQSKNKRIIVRIDTAFSWNNTIEGHNFWWELSNEFEN